MTTLVFFKNIFTTNGGVGFIILSFFFFLTDNRVEKRSYLHKNKRVL